MDKLKKLFFLLGLIFFGNLFAAAQTCTGDDFESQKKNAVAKIKSCSLVEQISFAFSKGIWCEAWSPVPATFVGKGITLKYIGVFHTLGESYSHRYIRKSIEEFNPTVVIVEGLHEDPILKEAIKRFSEPYRDDFNDSNYILHICGQKNLDWIGGEPTKQKKLDFMVQKGYTLKEQCCLDFITSTSISAREGRFISLQEELNALNKLFKTYYGTVPVLSLTNAEFEGVCREKYGRVLTEKELKNDYFLYSGSHFFKRMNEEKGLIRDTSAVTKIIEATRTHKRILVVYGASHFVRQYEALKSFFGSEPVYSRPLWLNILWQGAKTVAWGAKSFWQTYMNDRGALSY